MASEKEKKIETVKRMIDAIGEGPVSVLIERDGVNSSTVASKISGFQTGDKKVTICAVFASRGDRNKVQLSVRMFEVREIKKDGIDWTIIRNKKGQRVSFGQVIIDADPDETRRAKLLKKDKPLRERAAKTLKKKVENVAFEVIA